MARGQAKSILAEVVADTSSGYTVIAKVPAWASTAIVHIYGDDDTDSTQSSFATKMFSCNPFADTITIANSGSTQTTVTLTDCPQSGSFQLTVGGTDTDYMPFNVDPYKMSFAIAKAAGAQTSAALVTRTGTGTKAGMGAIAYGAADDPYVYSLNNAGNLTVTAKSNLFGAVVDTGTNFLDFGGTTAVVGASEYAQIHMGASVSNTADPGDVTAHTYKLVGLLSGYIGVNVVTDVTTDTACTYSTKIIAEWMGGA
jgi:hypothetical protein